MSTAARVPSAVEAGTSVARPHEAAEAGLPHVAEPGAVAPHDARELSVLFFRRLRTLEEGTPEYQYARNTLIEMNLTLVRYAAGRFRHRHQSEEDIVQVGTIGLIKAIDRFDLDRGVEFTSYAVPYITGEMRRFFRDTTWAVHVPRRLQELRIRLAMANEELLAELGRPASAEEVAGHLGITVEEVVEGQVAANGYSAESLDGALSDRDEADGHSLGDRLGACDPAFDAIEGFEAVRPLLAELGDRDRRILELRFGEELTQSQIGERLGISQMHVSRLLSACLKRLRTAVNEDSA
ncbi:RNA polymerase sigma factor SigF [Streptomyces sp. RKND-216]|uniref:RNA polymerase sigma factor SigF n=1 Tax=Streptomyces sp. RKND-216 TaxID=2562581 RepID=UPI00109DE6A5|nr:RNA polymerase sigma factor SigF [Streptomyces sp. RKND-216]THA25939.1 RNA polymerase sigma factor SigF [Streptomyces sp. RKND-216]